MKKTKVSVSRAIKLSILVPIAISLFYTYLNPFSWSSTECLLMIFCSLLIIWLMCDEASLNNRSTPRSVRVPYFKIKFWLKVIKVLLLKLLKILGPEIRKISVSVIENLEFEKTIGDRGVGDGASKNAQNSAIVGYNKPEATTCPNVIQPQKEETFHGQPHHSGFCGFQKDKKLVNILDGSVWWKLLFSVVFATIIMAILMALVMYFLYVVLELPSDTVHLVAIILVFGSIVISLYHVPRLIIAQSHVRARDIGVTKLPSVAVFFSLVFCGFGFWYLRKPVGFLLTLVFAFLFSLAGPWFGVFVIIISCIFTHKLAWKEVGQQLHEKQEGRTEAT